MPKPTPVYWWDYSENTTAIIVQSDRKGGECLARFTFADNAETAIAKAEALIADFCAGRKTPDWGNVRK